MRAGAEVMLREDGLEEEAEQGAAEGA